MRRQMLEVLVIVDFVKEFQRRVFNAATITNGRQITVRMPDIVMWRDLTITQFVCPRERISNTVISQRIGDEVAYQFSPVLIHLIQ